MAKRIKVLEKETPCFLCLQDLQKNRRGAQNQAILTTMKASMKLMDPSKAIGSETE